MKHYYLHTMDGQPATFDPEDRVLYAASPRRPVALVATLRQLRREQRQSLRTAARLGRSDLLSDYDYQRVRTP